MSEETLLALAEKGWTPEQIATVASMFKTPDPTSADVTIMSAEPEYNPMEEINKEIFGS